jgi:hypothetical protein
MFTRETEKTTRTGKSKISFAEFAIYHSAEPLFQQMRVNTSFDHLDYNFFAEQFSKVKIKTLLKLQSDCNFNFFLFFRTPIMKRLS